MLMNKGKKVDPFNKLLKEQKCVEELRKEGLDISSIKSFNGENIIQDHPMIGIHHKSFHWKKLQKMLESLKKV
jgi:hypothetical protein